MEQHVLQVIGASLSTSEDGGSSSSSSSSSSSINKLMGTVVPLLVIFIPLILAFLYLRQRQQRIYAPRSFLDILKDGEKTPKPALGMFNWIGPFRNLPDDFVLNHQSLDNYLFIRYFRMISLITFVGTIITWPTLLVVNSRGGGGESELEKFTFSNVTDISQYWWHTIIAWVFSIYVMYIITRETVYYINLRQAFLTTPRQASRLSTRVVLFTGVPEPYRDPRWIKGDFAGVKHVWIATDCTELDALVSTMKDTASSLEDAVLKVSTIATKKHLKGEKHFSEDPERAGTEWVSPSERPYKRINPPVIGRKVDAVAYYRDQLQLLVPQVEFAQSRQASSSGKLLPALFVEFETQRAAQAAYSAPFWNQPANIEPACIGISSPDEIVWENLRIGKVERSARTIIANVVIVCLIIFWSIPVGLVGSLADLDMLAKYIPALGNLPPSVESIVSGLLPTILISALLALVPIICRYTARKAGSVTLKDIELRTQGWYFAFQVVQLFLITTFSSGAAAVAKEIIQDPTKAPTLLAENLPNASTFYLSFFVLQGVAVTASTIFQIAPFLVFNLLAPFLDNTPRKKFDRYITLSGLTWGDTYPRFTVFAVIAITYACIAPLVLGFATLGLYFLYLAFRYNVFYVLTMLVDTKGEAYGRAMQHLAWGVYLLELCLIGLLGARGAQIQAGLMVVLFILTMIWQIYLNSILSPLTQTLSDELMAQDEEEALAEASDQGGEEPLGTGSDISVQPRAPLTPQKTEPTVTGKLIAHARYGGLFAPWLFNGSRSQYPQLRKQLWEAFPGQPAPRLNDEIRKHAFHHPSISVKPPKIWVARDELGVSKQECAEAKRQGIEMTDEGAWFDEKGKVVWGQESLREAPIYEERIEY